MPMGLELAQGTARLEGRWGHAPTEGMCNVYAPPPTCLRYSQAPNYHSAHVRCRSHGVSYVRRLKLYCRATWTPPAPCNLCLVIANPQPNELWKKGWRTLSQTSKKKPCDSAEETKMQINSASWATTKHAARSATSTDLTMAPAPLMSQQEHIHHLHAAHTPANPDHTGINGGRTASRHPVPPGFVCNHCPYLCLPANCCYGGY